MIPKIIHYCWFGRKPLTPLAQKCIASWRQFLPDYEIREWNEDNFDVAYIPYTAQAYQAGKYAFVSDYARFWVLYRYGGVYFDTDVEVIRSMEDILKRGPFMGFEFLGDQMAVNPGLGLAAQPEMPLNKTMLDRYEGLSFLLPDGTVNPCTMIPMVTELLTEKGLKGDGSIEHLEGIDIYPPDWFNPFDDALGRLCKTENTRTIHWYAKSWMTAEPAWKTELKRLLRRIFGKERVMHLGQLVKKG
jgi:mannosyltransferase OCH1-like enzyme